MWNVFDNFWRISGNFISKQNSRLEVFQRIRCLRLQRLPSLRSRQETVCIIQRIWDNFFKPIVINWVGCRVLRQNLLRLSQFRMLLLIIGDILNCGVANFIFWDHVKDTVLGSLAFLAQRVLLLAVGIYEFTEDKLLVWRRGVKRTGLISFILSLEVIAFPCFAVSHESTRFWLVLHHAYAQFDSFSQSVMVFIRNIEV